jgi:hypothetical protein
MLAFRSGRDQPAGTGPLTFHPGMSNALKPDYLKVRQHLLELRDPLLNLHKALVDSERVFYEQTIGKILSPHHFLRLLAGDPWFVWLHPLSELIVTIDAVLDAKTPPQATRLEDLVRQSYRLLVPAEPSQNPANQGFAMHYFEALQRDPDVVVAHAEVAKLRRTRPAG